MTRDTQLQKIISRAIDMHVHIGPEVIPRRYTAASLAASERGKLAGAVLKNHFYPTVAMIDPIQTDNFTEFGSIVLNWPVGGLNPEAIRAAAYISQQPLIVWLPTIHAQNFLDNSEYELAPEWCSGQDIKPRKAKDVAGIGLLDDKGKLTDAAKAVAEAIEQVGGILATGHVSAAESMAIVDYAEQIGIADIVLTHPIYQRIAMPPKFQLQLARKGCFIEVCYSMFSLDGISIDKLVEQIRQIGPQQTILSSDVGQLTSQSPSESLLVFCNLLVERDIPVKWIEMMLVTNPKKILRVKD